MVDTKNAVKRPARSRKIKVEEHSDEDRKAPKRKSSVKIKHEENKRIKIETASGSKSQQVRKHLKETKSRKTTLIRTKLKKEKDQKVKVKKDVGAKSGKKTVQKSDHSCRKLVGAHVSIQGGLYKAVHEAVDIGARSFGLFLRSQRQWAAKSLDAKVAEKFRDACQEYGFGPDQILPHGSYLFNVGSPNPETLKKSRDGLVDELRRCEKLGLTLYNFHPGSSCGETTVDKCISTIAQSINMAHAKTKYVTTVIENMCCQGNTIGGKFEELREIIDKVKDKSRIGVCLDTCHAFAAGFDLTSDAGYKKFVSDFSRIVGFKYLKAVHLNDSVGKCGCHLDRHENIGRGKIGLDGFRRVMTDPHFNNIPMILETPGDFGYDKEIKILHKLC